MHAMADSVSGSAFELHLQGGFTKAAVLHMANLIHDQSDCPPSLCQNHKGDVGGSGHLAWISGPL